jgi:hypothetical protein
VNSQHDQSDAAATDDYICIQCGERLYAQRCKIICPRCGYREDCADAGLIDYDLIERRKARREVDRLPAKDHIHPRKD